MNATTDTRWTADSDYRDEAAPRGYGRDILARKATRVEAERALIAAINDHEDATGHPVPPVHSLAGQDVDLLPRVQTLIRRDRKGLTHG